MNGKMKNSIILLAALVCTSLHDGNGITYGEFDGK